MEALQGKTAIVIGATSGVGRATAKALVASGVRVTAVARSADQLAELGSAIPVGLQILRADASEPETAERLLGESRPDFVVLAAGVRPKLLPLDQHSWESFSEPWNSDTKAAFHVVKAALGLPLRPGSTVVVVSSGAAINGSPLSGGYAGAKRMQWLLASYAQQLADAKKLGLRFLAVLPKQMIEGTKIATEASAAYGARQGISGSEFMKRYGVPLDADGVAAAIIHGLLGQVAQGTTAIAVTGRGIEALG